MADTTQITTADVLSQLVIARDLCDALPDATPQKAQLAAAIKQAAIFAQKSQIPPGTYVTAGAAAAMSGVAVLVGVGGGFLLGNKYAGHKQKKLAEGAQHNELPPAPNPVPRRKPAAAAAPPAGEPT